MSYGIKSIGYNFERLQNILDAARSLNEAGDNKGAEDILVKLADEIKGGK